MSSPLKKENIVSKEVYQYFSQLIKKKTGITYSEKDYYRLDSRINHLIKKYSLADALSLMEYFQKNPSSEIDEALIEIATNNETFFYRDSRPFEALSGEILTDIKNSLLEGQKIEIWSCCCSYGQEPLSIFMALHKRWPFLANNRLEIWATDISNAALDKLRSFTYSELEIKRGLPMEDLSSYFRANNQEFSFKEEFRKYFKISRFNLLTDTFPKNKFHVIFCRNVLIYMDMDEKKRIITKLYESLLPGAYLYLGSGESMLGQNENFEQVFLSGGLAFRKPKVG